MSLIPFILDLADELHEFSRCLANGVDINDFGFGLYTGTDQQQQPQQHQHQQQQQQTSPRRSRTSSFSSFWMPSKRHHPYNRIKTACCGKSAEETVVNLEKSDGSASSIGGTPGKSASYSVVNKNGFQVSMNVKQFTLNELSVKTIDNCIVVEGRHDDKEDGHGVISRHFVRKYMLPKGYDPNDVLSTLSSNGILTVKAPPPPPPATKNDEPNERVIEIQPTPGPTPALVVSAKDMPAKETTKKLATTPSVRLECQLPEKRQKLDLPPESEPEESTAPATIIENDSDSASAPVVGTEILSNDVEMGQADEKITEIVVKQTEQQQTRNIAEIEIGIEKKAEAIRQPEKLLEKEQEKILNETDKKCLDECMPESNGISKVIDEQIEESLCVPDAAEATDKIKDETPAEIKFPEINENAKKMDVDGEDEGKNNEKQKIDNSEFVVASIKTADSETKTAATVVTAAASDVSAKHMDTHLEKTNNTETCNTAITIDVPTTNTTANNNNNNNNNANTNHSNSSASTNTNNSSPEVFTENSGNDIKDGNGVVTGKIPVVIPNSAENVAASTTTTTNKTAGIADDKAESVADGEIATETAVPTTDTKTNIEDVALLKAATADPTAIKDNTDINVILTESIDGITTTADLSTNATATTTTSVDSVECSLFAKKTHLGNGNDTTPTPIVATEEMAN